MSVQLETCRDCGATGPAPTSPDDPAPGLCPRCLDRRFAELTTAAEIVLDLVPPAVFARWASRNLQRHVGLTPAATSRFLERMAAGIGGRRP